jgi:superfamily II DNA/RNA helicase
MTLVGYFNSMRELGGMRRAVEDAVSSRVRKMRDRGLANRFTDSIEELTSRKSAADIPLILDRLEAVFDPVRAEERKQKRKAGEATDYAQHPIDVLLATNMISVGVDVPRLGLMVVAGQPKTTAEYIQATSRIGRRYPGLVCVVYNWARPRDLSHYERFEHYHATFFQHVEALSITPYSSRAIERGLTALLVASVRLSGKDFNQNIKAGQISRTHPTVQNALKAISRRAGLVTSRSDVEAQVQQELDDRLDQWLNRAQATTGGARLGYKQGTDGQTLGLLHSPASTGWDDFTCLNSLRDVEPGINLILKDHGMDREPDQAAADTPNEGQT